MHKWILHLHDFNFLRHKTAKTLIEALIAEELW